MTHEEIAFNITAYFETSSLKPYSVISSNFDGQGVSWGPHQINLGQGTLQPVLKGIHEKYSGFLSSVLEQCLDTSGVMQSSFLDLLGAKSNRAAVDLVEAEWHHTVVIQGKNRRRLKPQWVKFFELLGESNLVQALIRAETKWIDIKASELAQWIAKGSKPTVRMYCLAYDLVTQNGGIGAGHRAALTAARPFLRVYRNRLERKGKSVDWAWMNIVAGTRALMTRITGQTKFAADVASRKFLIVDGEGDFRGSFVDLDQKFGLSDQAI